MKVVECWVLIVTAIPYIQNHDHMGTRQHNAILHDITPHPIMLCRTTPRHAAPQTETFKIIVLTQRRHRSLQRLLESVEATDYDVPNAKPPHLQIRIDQHDSHDHALTIDVANNFEFSHGTKSVVVSTEWQGLQRAWFNAWKPVSNDERAVCKRFAHV